LYLYKDGIGDCYRILINSGEHKSKFYATESHCLNIFDLLKSLHFLPTTMNLGVCHGDVNLLLACGLPTQRKSFIHSKIIFNPKYKLNHIFHDDAFPNFSWFYLIINEITIIKEISEITMYPVQDIENMYNRKTHMGSKEAIKYNIIDEILL